MTLNFKKLNPEYKAAIVFSVLALFLSLLVGIFSGIKIGVVLIRAFFAAFLFAGLGYVVLHTIRNYVPEFIDFLTGINRVEKDDFDTDEEAENELAETNQESSGDDFTELTGSDFPKVDSNASDNSAGNTTGSPGSMGKHIVNEDSDFPYEPVELAKAVRTMMNKDE